MTEFFRDIFEYQHHYNQKLAELMMAHERDISSRSLPMFSHMVNAHQIWNSRILQSKSLGVNDVRTFSENMELDTTNFEDSLHILERYDIQEQIEFRTFGGVSFSNTVGEILFHVSNHHTHHRAQLVSDLRQAGIEPIVTDYIFYKR